VDKLIIYKGGGYDGCFWEYNAALSRDGKLYNIYTSGRAGIPGFNGSKIDVLEKSEEVDAAIKHAMGEEGWEVCLDVQADIDGLTKRLPANFVKCILGRVTDITDLRYEVLCSLCDVYIGVDEAELSDAHGCGGLMSCCDDFVCDECVSSHTCDVCNCRYDDTEFVGGACPECVRGALKLVPSIQSQVEILEHAINIGETQLQSMCEIFPDRAAKLKTMHRYNARMFEGTIAKLVGEAVELFKDRSW